MSGLHSPAVPTIWLYCAARLRTEDSTLFAICDQPERSFAVDGKSSESPIISLILTGRGIFRFGGSTSKVPMRLQVTTGTYVSDTSIYTPCIKTIMEPVRISTP